jgi:hypothetical protein
MTPQQTASLLEAISARQAGTRHPSIGMDGGTAPVVVSIGYVAKTGMVLHDGIVIIDAPPVITDVVMKWVDEQNGEEINHVAVEADQGGMVVR